MEVKSTCSVCGKPYMKRNGKSKYCSDDCKREATRLRQKSWREAHPDYQADWRKAHPGYDEEWHDSHPNYNRDRSRAKRGTKLIEQSCVVCGTVFTTAYPQKITCSAKCRRKFRERHKDYRLKGKVVDSDITLEKLFTRDLGVCYLCGEACDWEDRTGLATGMKYPTIEHVVPLSRGGLHSWENVKLAHMGCNIRKSNTLLSEASHGEESGI